MGETNGTDDVRTVTYCLVPRELAGRLHESLRKQFAHDPSVEVVVERRDEDRRALGERRQAEQDTDAERRRIRNAGGRRVAPQRAPALAVDAPILPRKARPYADRLAFVERIEPSQEHLADIDSARLVIRFQAGDRDAFATLYTRYFDRIYGYLRAIFREDTHEVEDLTQQVFVRAFEALPRYERRAQPFRAWLFTIVRNVAQTRVRQRARSEPVEPAVISGRADTTSSPEEARTTLSWLTDRELVMFVERLPLSQRQVLVLKYMLDLPAKEIAQILGRTHDDVRMLEHRALRFLEARLTATGRRSADERGRSLPSYGRVRWAPVLRRRGSALRRNPGRVRI